MTMVIEWIKKNPSPFVLALEQGEVAIKVCKRCGDARRIVFCGNKIKIIHCF